MLHQEKSGNPETYYIICERWLKRRADVAQVVLPPCHCFWLVSKSKNKVAGLASFLAFRLFQSQLDTMFSA
jgi:hypothetical protein